MCMYSVYTMMRSRMTRFQRIINLNINININIKHIGPYRLSQVSMPMVHSSTDFLSRCSAFHTSTVLYHGKYSLNMQQLHTRNKITDISMVRLRGIFSFIGLTMSILSYMMYAIWFLWCVWHVLQYYFFFIIFFITLRALGLENSRFFIISFDLTWFWGKYLQFQ